MATETTTIALTTKEWQLVAALRDLPESPLKELTERAIDQLLELARQPGCYEMQADGVPCATPTADCAECVKVKRVLAALQRSIDEP
jgi:hypothetical protein